MECVTLHDTSFLCPTICSALKSNPFKRLPEPCKLRGDAKAGSSQLHSPGVSVNDAFAECLLSMGVTWQVKFAFIAGVAVVLLLIPVNHWLATKIEGASTVMMACKDLRIKRMGELLRGIRQIKAAAWEPNFTARVRSPAEYNFEIGSAPRVKARSFSLTLPASPFGSFSQRELCKHYQVLQDFSFICIAHKSKKSPGSLHLWLFAHLYTSQHVQGCKVPWLNPGLHVA